jgi:hypothetical protein
MLGTSWVMEQILVIENGSSIELVCLLEVRLATNLLYLQYLGGCRDKLIKKKLHKYNDINSALQLLQTCLLDTEMQQKAVSFINITYNTTKINA